MALLIWLGSPGQWFLAHVRSSLHKDCQNRFQSTRRSNHDDNLLES